MKIIEAKINFNPIKSLFYICSLSRVKMSHSGLGGWIDQFKNCFALTEMPSDRNATEDCAKSYKLTKYQGLIKKLREPGTAKQGLTLCLETYSNQQHGSPTADVITKGNAWQGCASVEGMRSQSLIFTRTPSMKSHICRNDEYVPNTIEKYSQQVNRKQCLLRMMQVEQTSATELVLQGGK